MVSATGNWRPGRPHDTGNIFNYETLKVAKPKCNTPSVEARHALMEGSP